MKIAVYTALFGNKDVLYPPLHYTEIDKVDYFIFTDDSSININPYKVVEKPLVFNDVAKNARYFKILGDDLLKAYDILIWHDANIQICHDIIPELIKKSQHTFLTAFIHPTKNDFYSEAMSCIRTDKDFSLRILKQVFFYFFQGLPAHNGLCSTGILIKNYKFKANGMLQFWWEQTLKYSRRDQLSLAFTVYKTEINLGIIQENIFGNKYSKYHLHNYNHYNERFNIMRYNYLVLKKISFYIVKTLRKIKKAFK